MTSPEATGQEGREAQYGALGETSTNPAHPLDDRSCSMTATEDAERWAELTERLAVVDAMPSTNLVAAMYGDDVRWLMARCSAARVEGRRNGLLEAADRLDRAREMRTQSRPLDTESRAYVAWKAFDQAAGTVGAVLRGEAVK